MSLLLQIVVLVAVVIWLGTLSTDQGPILGEGAFIIALATMSFLAMAVNGAVWLIRWLRGQSPEQDLPPPGSA